MIPADLSALVRPRSDPASGNGGEGATGGDAKGGAGALFGRALDSLAGRGEPQNAPPGGDDARQRDGRTPGSQGEPDGGSDAAPRATRALRSLSFTLERALPIRPGALAFQARAEVAAKGEDDGATPGEATAEGAAGLLAALASGSGATTARAVAQRTTETPAVRTGAPNAGAHPASADDAASESRSAPLSRAAALFPESADLALATKAEPTPGMALKATVVAQATHLPPVLGPANLAAIVDAAGTLLSESDGRGRATLAFSPDLADPGAQVRAQPVRVLTVQLQPVSLGTVTISLRMTADGVAMEITAADAKAAAMLRRDESLIVDAVRRSGIAGEVVAIHTADGPRGATASQTAAAGGPGGEAARDASANGGDGQRGPRRDEDGSDFDRRSDDDPVGPDGGGGRARFDDGVYL